MTCTEFDGYICIDNVTDLDLRQTLDCGQSFRWTENADGSFDGIAFGKKVRVRLDGERLYIENSNKADFESIWKDYFDLELDYGKIREQISEIHPVLKEAAKYAPGIRILRQEPYEALCTFIISQNNNIKRIKGIVQRLCENFGKQISYMGKTYYTFPDTDTIYSLSKEDLSVIRSGFRDKYIMDAADKFKSGTLTEEYIKSLSTPDAKKALMTINGVGNKVSDCILLFGLGRVDSFPVDVWIKRIMEYCYFDGEQSIPAISAFAEKHFGDIGGFAQQYLFFYARENKIGTE